MVENCPELEPVCCKKRQKKVQTKKLFWASRGSDWYQIDHKCSFRINLVSIRAFIPIAQNLVWTFFAVSYSKPAVRMGLGFNPRRFNEFKGLIEI